MIYYSGDFAKSNEVPDLAKAVFPYKYFQNIESMKASEEFPTYDDFRTSLLKPEPEHVNEFLKIVQTMIANAKITTIR